MLGCPILKVWSSVETPFSCASRTRDFRQLANSNVDVLVIGGGITGAGVARDAARRGLVTALVDRGDFASGTSSRSSRLIHGGIRYLEYKEWHLVFEASRERRRLRRLAPHLVRPLPFLIPAYRGSRVPPWKLLAGLWLYDLLATFRNVRRHDWLGKQAVGRREPGLRDRDLVGAGVYYDAQCDDARLTLATVRDAAAHGARVLNYASVKEFRLADGRIRGAVIRDELSGEEITVQARQVVNATGPWADHVRRLGDPRCTPIVRLTRGTHIAVARERLGNHGAVTLTSPVDGRVFFVLPWRHLTYIGTTDVDFGDPDGVRPTGNDVTYLLSSANALFPGSRLASEDVWCAWAGLRALVRGAPGQPESTVSREHLIDQLPCGLLSIVGGKLTTYRAMAEAVVDRIVTIERGRGGGRDTRPCSTHTAALPGGEVRDL
ncbi:MAG TPA: glycerol-3-phosphate dehydrogenase/oxidase, partial [Vicinamibacterales bacterium]|nr:glycerol-3-phosphate dehydrogenase/oxidase [Vicinamibacterales bacterium]